MDLILETPGTRVSKRKGMIKISVPGDSNKEVAMREVESIILGNGVQITTQALKALSSYAVNIVYTSLGTPYGIYTPFANVGTVFTRRQQLAAYEDFRGIHLATQFVYAAIENKRRLLKYFAKNRKKSNPKKHRRLRHAATRIESAKAKLAKFSKTLSKRETVNHHRNELMGIEGFVAKIYFRELGALFPLGIKVQRRTRRPPRDPLNSLLSLGYTVLQGHVTTAIAAAGLELYGGFLHSDRSGKPSLALDLLEEFRQPVVDRLVTKLLITGQIQQDDFKDSIHGYRLKKENKTLFYKKLKGEVIGGTQAETFFEDTKLKNENGKKRNTSKIRLNYKREMIRQARKVANYLIGSTSKYEPFIMNW
jgi:CRISPR-associated protein Cas1